MGQQGEFIGCHAAVLYRDAAVESCMVEPVKVEGDAAQVVNATLLQAQSWCQFTVMVLALGMLAPAGGSDYGALDGWIAAVRQNDRPRQVGEVLEDVAKRAAGQPAEPPAK